MGFPVLVRWHLYIDSAPRASTATMLTNTSTLNMRGTTLHWRHNGRGGVSNHHTHDCSLNRLFRLGSKKTSQLRVTGLCAGNSPVNSPHKWPVTRKMIPLDDVIMEFSRSNLANIMVACALPPCVAKSSVAMLLTIYEVGRSLSYMREDFNYLGRVNMEEWQNLYIRMFLLNNLTCKEFLLSNPEECV